MKIKAAFLSIVSLATLATVLVLPATGAAGGDTCNATQRKIEITPTVQSGDYGPTGANAALSFTAEVPAGSGLQPSTITGAVYRRSLGLLGWTTVRFRLESTVDGVEIWKTTRLPFFADPGDWLQIKATVAFEGCEMRFVDRTVVLP
jgi:hypothetical protein